MCQFIFSLVIGIPLGLLASVFMYLLLSTDKIIDYPTEDREQDNMV